MKRGTFALLVAPAVVLLALFFGLPVAGVVVDAFRDGLGAFGRVPAVIGPAPLVAPSVANPPAQELALFVEGRVAWLHSVPFSPPRLLWLEIPRP